MVDYGEVLYSSVILLFWLGKIPTIRTDVGQLIFIAEHYILATLHTVQP